MASVRLGLDVRHELLSGAERIDGAAGGLLSATRRGTRQGADVLEEAQRQTIRRRTGRTAGTIGSVVEDTPRGATAHVGTSDRIARMLNDGTRAHRIVATNAKALRFEVNGRTVFAKSVNHPGTSPTDWLDRSGTISLSPIERAFEDEVGEVFG